MAGPVIIGEVPGLRVYCECGCREFVKSKRGKPNRFVHGHYSRTKGHKSIVSRASKKAWLNPERKKKMVNLLKKRWLDPEYRRGVSDRMMGNEYLLGHKDSEETTQRRRESAKGRSVPEAVRLEGVRKAAEIRRGMSLSIEWRQKIGEASLRMWSDPEFKDRTVRAILKGNCIRPNKLEIKLWNLLNFLFPGVFKYVGDGSFIIAGKNPDFININGKKQIIEVWGDHWHKGQNPQDRIDHFKPFGYSTLIIWEHELKSPRLIGKIQEFVYLGNPISEEK